MSTPSEVTKMIKDQGIEFIDFKFCDLFGRWQHKTCPISEYHEELFTEGHGFDGSSIRGWQAINASDMLVIPDPKSAIVDPFMQYPTISFICNVVDPITKEGYTRDPRYIAQKAEAYLKSTGIGDTAFIGPEAEFFIFDDIRYDVAQQHSFYHIDSVAGVWNTGREESPNLGGKIRNKEGYFPVPPMDQFQDLRSEMVMVMQKVGIQVETHHSEVATAGQAEIDIRFAPLVEQADKLMWYKYICKNVARRHGRVVTFMPKPLFADNGSGMHTHQSIWKGGKPLFAGNGYAGLSEMALHYIAGIIKHGPALCALTNPTTNSYKRLVPGYEAPVNLAYSSRNRSASCRIPMYSPSPKAKRVEVRFPDPTATPYIAFAAMLMAGLDGIKKKMDPGEPFDKDLYSLPPEELKKVPSCPGSLDDALKNLEKDHEFLLQGDVFTPDLIETWIDYKRVNEIDPLRMRPHPLEFLHYFDA